MTLDCEERSKRRRNHLQQSLKPVENNPALAYIITMKVCRKSAAMERLRNPPPVPIRELLIIDAPIPERRGR